MTEQRLTDEQIMAAYDAALAGGGSADSCIIRTVRALLSADRGEPHKYEIDDAAQKTADTLRAIGSTCEDLPPGLLASAAQWIETYAADYFRLLREKHRRLAAAAPSTPQPAPRHVCGEQGFGALGDSCPACATPQPAPEWADIIEQRLLTWRQRLMNESGDRLALDDFMSQESIDDLVDFVCAPLATPQPDTVQVPRKAIQWAIDSLLELRELAGPSTFMDRANRAIRALKEQE